MPNDLAARSGSRLQIYLGVAHMMLLLAGIVGGLIAYTSSSATLAQKFEDFQQSVNAQLARVNMAVNELPVQTATIGQIETHLHAVDGRLDGMDTRLRDTENANAKIQANIDMLTRASSLPDPSRHGR